MLHNWVCKTIWMLFTWKDEVWRLPHQFFGNWNLSFRPEIREWVKSWWPRRKFSNCRNGILLICLPNGSKEKLLVVARIFQVLFIYFWLDFLITQNEIKSKWILKNMVMWFAHSRNVCQQSAIPRFCPKRRTMHCSGTDQSIFKSSTK